jgi:hypothetical protein
MWSRWDGRLGALGDRGEGMEDGRQWGKVG